MRFGQRPTIEQVERACRLKRLSQGMTVERDQVVTDLLADNRGEEAIPQGVQRTCMPQTPNGSSTWSSAQCA
jgi:hypothetical protein